MFFFNVVHHSQQEVLVFAIHAVVHAVVVDDAPLLHVYAQTRPVHVVAVAGHDDLVELEDVPAGNLLVPTLDFIVAVAPLFAVLQETGEEEALEEVTPFPAPSVCPVGGCVPLCQEGVPAVDDFVGQPLSRSKGLQIPAGDLVGTTSTYDVRTTSLMIQSYLDLCGCVCGGGSFASGWTVMLVSGQGKCPPFV